MASGQDDIEEFLDEHRARRATLSAAAEPTAIATTGSIADPLLLPNAPDEMAAITDRMFGDGAPSVVPPALSLGPASLPEDGGLLARSFVEALPLRQLRGRHLGRVSRATGDTTLPGVEEVVFPRLASLRSMTEASFVFAGATGTETLAVEPVDFETRARPVRLRLAASATGPFSPPRIELLTRMPGAALVLGRVSRPSRRATPVRIVALSWLDEQGRVPTFAYGLIPHHNMPVVVRAPVTWFGIQHGWFNELSYLVQVPEGRWFALRAASGWPPAEPP
jgi:hypothetical protein